MKLFDVTCRYHFFVKSLNRYELLVNQKYLNFVT